MLKELSPPARGRGLKPPSRTGVKRCSQLTCPPKSGPGIMLEFLTKEDGIWPGKDEHQNRL